MINDINMVKMEENMLALFDRNEVEYVKNEILSLVRQYKFEPRKKIRSHNGRYYKNNNDYLIEKEELFKNRQTPSVVWQAVKLYNNMNAVCEATKGPRVRNLFSFVEFLDYFELYLGGKKPNAHVHLARINKNDDYRPGNVAWIENRKKGKRVFHDIKNLYVMTYISKYFNIKMNDLFDISIRKGFISRYTNITSFKCALSKQKVNV